MAALSVGILALLLALDDGTDFGWTSPYILGLFALGAVAIVVFAIIERHAGPRALVPSDVLGNRQFAAACLATLMISAIFFSALLYVPQFMALSRWPAVAGITACRPKRTLARTLVSLPVDDGAVGEERLARRKGLRRVGMPSRHGEIDLDAEAGAIGDLPGTVDPSDGTVDHLEIPRHGAGHLLLDDEVRRRHVEVQRRHAGDRAEGIVRGDAGPRDLGESGDAAGLGEAAAMAEIGLGDGQAPRSR